jgi:ABC-type transport system involved in multi-copper enzyme maturation permease subunit
VSYSAGQLLSDTRRKWDRLATPFSAGAYWVRIEPGKDAHVIPQIDVAIDGNSVNVSAINIKQYALLLNSQLLDLDAPITIRTNGEVSFSRQIAEKAITDGKTTLIINLESKRAKWILVAVVGLVLLAGSGMVYLRLSRIRAQRLRMTQAEVPTFSVRRDSQSTNLTAGWRGIWLIAVKELRSQLLTEKFLWTTLLCLGMVLMSFWLMTQNYQSRQTNHSLSLRKKDDLYSGGGFWYDYRPGHGIGKPPYFRPMPIIKEPNVMSIFVQGLEKRMGRPAYYSLHQEVEFDDVPYANFLTDIHASPDLAHIVQIPMSLLALLFVFQSICGEREKGTLKLMLANAVPRDTILLGKWLGGYLGLVIPFLVAVAIGLLALILMPSISIAVEQWTRLAWLLAASLLYLSTFFTLGILISTLTKRTITSFLVALFAWVVLVLVWPNIGTLLAREMKPIESTQQLEVEKYLVKRRMEDEREKVQKSWWWVHTYGQIHLEIWHDVREAVWRLDAEHQRRTQQLGDYTRALTRLSPAAAYAYAMMDIAGTNISDELDYYYHLHRYVRSQPQEAQHFVTHILFKHHTWDFHYAPAPWQEGLNRALIDLLLLMLFNAVFFLCAYITFIRYEVT